MKARRLAVSVQNASQRDDLPPTSEFEAWIDAALGPGSHGEVNVRIVDEAESAQLNERFRHREGATNVLAFPADSALLEFDSEAPIGDLVICAPVVEREAREQRKSAVAHWAHLVVHGALHLAGYDHDTEPLAAEMEGREQSVLASLGYPDPYELRDQQAGE